jgi:hypothetical protein
VASVFKSKGNAYYTIVYTDEHGRRRKKKGYSDKRESECFARRLEERARKVKDGELDPKDERCGCQVCFHAWPTCSACV